MFDNIIETASATNEDANFPAQNVLEIHSKKRFKATTHSSTVTLTMGGGSNALALYNIQADSITLTGDINDSLSLVHNDGYGEYKAMAAFFAYSEIATTHTINVELTAASNDIALGIAFGGKAFGFTNPQWGLGNGSKSHSIIYDLDNGFEYIFKRNLSEMPTFSFQISSRTEYWNLLRLLKARYPNPIICKADDMETAEEHNLIWYGRLDSEPKGTLSTFGSYNVSFGLKEFL
jgi:hypothetical protein